MTQRLILFSMNLKLILILIGGTCFCISSAAYIFVKFLLRPKDGQTWEQEHWDYEDQNPTIKRYDFWCRFILSVVVISMLLIFISISI